MILSTKWMIKSTLKMTSWFQRSRKHDWMLSIFWLGAPEVQWLSPYRSRVQIKTSPPRSSALYSTTSKEKAMAPHSSPLAWKIPWMEEPGGLQSTGSLRVGHDWVTSLSLFTFMHWRRKWQPTPVFLPGKSQGWGKLVGCHLWGHRVGHDWSDLVAAAARQQDNSGGP